MPPHDRIFRGGPQLRLGPIRVSVASTGHCMDPVMYGCSTGSRAVNSLQQPALWSYPQPGDVAADALGPAVVCVRDRVGMSSCRRCSGGVSRPVIVPVLCRARSLVVSGRLSSAGGHEATSDGGSRRGYREGMGCGCDGAACRPGHARPAIGASGAPPVVRALRPAHSAA